jgi:hypothetical protein
VPVLIGALWAGQLLAAGTARATPPPSGRYGIDVACTVDNGMGVCRVEVDDLATGKELFRPQLASRLGLETSWRASCEMEDGLYAFELTAVIHETWAEVVYVVHRDDERLDSQVIRLELTGSAGSDSSGPSGTAPDGSPGT